MTKPKISVLTAVYNSAELIRPAIESVLNQTFGDFEWVIINDATPDNSIEIIESYNDPRIKIYHNETNMGLAASLNKGLALCTGEYIARMDTDDVCYPNRFERQVAFMGAHPEVAIAGSWVNLTGDWKGLWKTPVHHEEIQCKLLFNSAIAHPTVMMRKNELDKFGLRYDSRLKKIQDYDLWVRASQVVKLANIPEVLLDYRIDIEAKSPEVVKRSNEVIYGIRQMQLSRLDIKLSPYEADNFHYISANQPDKVDATVINKLFSSILSKNNQAKLYNQKALQRHLGRTWIRMVLKKPAAVFSTPLSLILTAIKSLFL
jgi:glycosyltransferase involved in cell wall biosynthesis